MSQLRVIKVEGEATRFHVESGSWCCTRCDATFNRRLKPDLKLGDPCPTCLKRKAGGGPKRDRYKVFKSGVWKDEPYSGPVGRLDHRWHLVDIAAFNLNGQCSCEFFCYGIGPALRTMSPAEQGSCQKWCSHIAAARRFALDVALRAHEASRLGRREEEAA